MIAEQTQQEQVTEFGRRLHDGVLQLLEFMSTGGYGRLEETAEYQELAQWAATELRELIDQPGDMLHSDLMSAVRGIASQQPYRADGVELLVDVDEACRGISAAAVQPIVLAAREAVSNAMKHSDGTVVSLRCSRTADRVVIDVSDNGVGIPDGCTAGYGIRNSIVGRVTEAGGCVEITRARRRGTLVHMELRTQPSCRGIA